jgi:hypothetical protein
MMSQAGQDMWQKRSLHAVRMYRQQLSWLSSIVLLQAQRSLDTRRTRALAQQYCNVTKTPPQHTQPFVQQVQL